VFELRDYQIDNNNRVRRLEDFGPVRVCCCSPTGSGKSVMEADMLLDDKPQLLLTHRRFLVGSAFR
jgi:superfamily II DNA or RNA helicase